MLRHSQNFPGSCSRRLLLISLTFVLFPLMLLSLQGCRQTQGVIRKGETIIIDIQGEKGRFYAATLEQRDADLTMTLITPNGEPHLVDYFYGANTEEKIFWKSDVAGKYQIKITTTPNNQDLRAHYKLIIQPPRDPTAQDLDRLESQRLFEEAAQLAEKTQSDEKESEQNRDRMAKMYEESARKWRAAGEP